MSAPAELRCKPHSRRYIDGIPLPWTNVLGKGTKIWFRWCLAAPPAVGIFSGPTNAEWADTQARFGEDIVTSLAVDPCLLAKDPTHPSRLRHARRRDSLFGAAPHRGRTAGTTADTAGPVPATAAFPPTGAAVADPAGAAGRPPVRPFASQPTAFPRVPPQRKPSTHRNASAR